MTTHIFQTDDLGLAAKLHAVVLTHHAHPGAAPTALMHVPPTPAVAPPVVTPAPVAPPPPPPPAAAAPPPPPPAAAAPPPPPPPSPAAAPAAPVGVDPSLMVAPAGWTVEHVQAAGKAFTVKHGSAGAGKFVEMCKRFSPEGTAKPSIKTVLPAYWPTMHQELVA